MKNKKHKNEYLILQYTYIYIVNKMQKFKTAEEKPLKTEADYL